MTPYNEHLERDFKPIPPLDLIYTKEIADAYTLHRFYDNYAALINIYSQVAKRVPNFDPVSIMDFGAGSGTALW